jgi:ferredoxin-NADP reductase
MGEKVARVATAVTIAPSVLQLELDCVDPPVLAYKPGQFASVRVDASGNVRRSYSIASHPTRDRGGAIEFLVKLVPGGVGSAFFAHLHRGDPVHFTGPLGFFVPDAHHEADVVFAATGAGIAAALPMLEDILARTNEHGRVLLFWGLRTEEDLYWQGRLAALEALAGPRFEPIVSLSRASPAWKGLHGHITPHVLAAAPELRYPIFYVVGHGEMIRDVRDGLVAQGIDRKKQFRNEVFYPAAKAAVAAPVA